MKDIMDEKKSSFIKGFEDFKQKKNQDLDEEMEEKNLIEYFNEKIINLLKSKNDRNTKEILNFSKKNKALKVEGEPIELCKKYLRFSFSNGNDDINLEYPKIMLIQPFKNLKHIYMSIFFGEDYEMNENFPNYKLLHSFIFSSIKRKILVPKRILEKYPKDQPGSKIKLLFDNFLDNSNENEETKQRLNNEIEKITNAFGKKK